MDIQSVVKPRKGNLYKFVDILTYQTELSPAHMAAALLYFGMQPKNRFAPFFNRLLSWIFNSVAG